ncbi:unnamed protein product [Caenorhabditis angaria]|uniref:Synembryn n=1 Tax=Caenorhabditis angaria TaxID=860376 RepID=A0A9P1IMP0_9PELO|nr:unnamed protein product [Caenorhabditis angaria]
MRDRLAFYSENSQILLNYLRDFEESKRIKSGEKWIRNLSKEENAEIWYLYHRIAFIVTALIKPIQKSWSQNRETVPNLLIPCESLLLLENSQEMDKNRANEALKTMFNVFCHCDENCVKSEIVENANLILKKLMISERIDDEIKQSAVNCFALPTIQPVLSILCDKNLENMEFTQSLLNLLERKLDELPSDIHNIPTTSADLIGPNFSGLSRLCKESKFARRYCRMKVLPPLTNQDIEKRPEEQKSLRGKIVRLMMTPTCAKDIASQFLFILCKKSVGRMIKYTGFGHSAGLIANMGLLGQINEPKRESDSEDSETDEYNEVKDNVNPVTGSLFDPERGSAIANMTDEQKEYEAMKLLDAMNKMMDAGVVKPGTIGEDGKLREVSHVLELTKNVQIKDDEDSD